MSVKSILLLSLIVKTDTYQYCNCYISNHFTDQYCAVVFPRIYYSLTFRPTTFTRHQQIEKSNHCWLQKSPSLFKSHNSTGYLLVGNILFLLLLCCISNCGWRVSVTEAQLGCFRIIATDHPHCHVQTLETTTENITR